MTGKVDPFLNDKNALERLKEDYRTHGSLIVAVDFDLTIHDYHKTGHIFPMMEELIKRCNNAGFKVVIFTANPDVDYVKQYCSDNNIKIDGVNKNLIKAFDSAGKIYYNIFLDDRAGLKQSYDTLTEVLDCIDRGEL